MPERYIDDPYEQLNDEAAEQETQLREALAEAMEAVIWFSGMEIPRGAFPYWQKIRDEQMPRWREALEGDHK